MRAIGVLMVAACSTPPAPHAPPPQPPVPRAPIAADAAPAPAIVVDAPPPAPAFDTAACARAIDALGTCATAPPDRDALAARCTAAHDADACLVAAVAFADAAHALPASVELLPDPPSHMPWVYAQPAPPPFATANPDLPRARALFAAACPAHPRACIPAGAPARGCPASAVACTAALPSKDPAVHAALATACKRAPSASACNGLAFLSHARGDHLVACANGSLLSCIALVEAGAPGPRDMGDAIFALFDDACRETGHERACFAAVRVIETGWGGVYWRNTNAVVEILTTACDELHSAKACKRLAQVTASVGQGVR